MQGRGKHWVGLVVFLGASACGGAGDGRGGNGGEAERWVDQPGEGGNVDDDSMTGGEAPADDATCDWIETANIGELPLNVRAEPRVDAAKLGKIYPSQVVAALDEVTGDTVSDGAVGSTDVWIEIELGTKVGYVTALYTECTDEPEIGDWVWPVPLNHSYLQDFGNTIGYQGCGFHTGLDIGGQIGDPIVAAGAGVVVHVGPLWLSGKGVGRGPNAIIIQHGDGDLYSTYSHNDAALVEFGDVVEAGDPIAELGSLGYSGGPHLHLEFLEGTPYTGDWQTPFDDACSHYVDPKIYVQP